MIKHRYLETLTYYLIVLSDFFLWKLYGQYECNKNQNNQKIIVAICKYNK